MLEKKLSKPAGLSQLYLRNYAANLAGNFIIILLNFFTPLAVYDDWKTFHAKGGWIMIPIIIFTIFTVATGLQYLIQRPISIALRQIRSGKEPDRAVLKTAGRRLLNLPFVLGLANLSLWVVFTSISTVDISFPFSSYTG